MNFLLGFVVAVALLSVVADTRAQSQVGASAMAAEPLKLLFIGNSLTYYNSMPGMVAAMAEAAGSVRPVRAKAVTDSGRGAGEMFANMRTRTALAEERWDYVVLQIVPTAGWDEPDRLAVAARDIDAAIKKAGGKTVFYVTSLLKDRLHL